MTGGGGGGADGLERNFGISLRSLRLEREDCPDALPIMAAPSGIVDVSSHRDRSGKRAVLHRSDFVAPKRSLSEVQSATELPCFLTVKSLRQYHAKGVLPPQYVAEGGRHSGFIPLTRESGMREACNVVPRAWFGKPSARSPCVC